MMTWTLTLLLGAVLGLLLWILLQRWLGFASQRPEDYRGSSPEFDLRQALDGPILCEGVIYGPVGRVAARFVAEMEAEWQGDRGVLREAFTYDNGSTQDREWRLNLGPGGTIRAEADDIVGRAEGRQSGASVMLRYRLRLPEASGGHVLDVVDWMYLAQNGTIINRSQFRKFGVTVAELVATMRRKEPAPALAAE